MPRLASICSPPEPDAAFYSLPETGDRTLFKHCIHAALTSNFSFHEQIKRSLSSAGFLVGRIQKHWFHDVYEIKMQRGQVIRDATENQLRRKILRALRSESINYDRETFVLSVQGQRIVCAFCYKLGAEGHI